MASKDAVKENVKEAPKVDNSKQIPSLASYYLLGRSGLRVSPLAFGTGTFGDAWGEVADLEAILHEGVGKSHRHLGRPSREVSS